MPALDTIGTLVVYTRAGQVLLPLLPGSDFADGLERSVPALASPLYGPVNSVTRVARPAILARTVLFDTWFSAAQLGLLFGRDPVTGALASWGNVRWFRPGFGYLRFTRVKLDAMRLTWRGDHPVVAELLLYPHGYRTMSGGTVPAAPRGAPWPSHMTYIGSFTRVVGGSLTLVNGLVPNTSSPHWLSMDRLLYPVDYANDAMGATLVLDSHDDGAVMPYGAYTDRRWLNVYFRNAQATRQVRVAVSAMHPSLRQEVRIAPGVTRRTYEAIKPTSGDPLVVVT